MTDKAFQDHYKDELSVCYGCGRLNPHGLQIKSFWDGDETVCRFTPKAYHTAIEGYVYGGLIASLVGLPRHGNRSSSSLQGGGTPNGHRTGSSLCHRLPAGRLPETNPHRCTIGIARAGRSDKGKKGCGHHNGDLRRRTVCQGQGGGRPDAGALQKPASLNQ
jgi:hypothetical protein